MKNQTVVLPQEVAQIAENVSVEKRSEVQEVLNHVFNGVSKMREQLDSVEVADVNDKVNMKLANTIRLGVRQVRLDAEKTFDAKRSEVQKQMLSYKTEDSLWLKAKQTMQILTKEIEENARWKEETKQRFEAEQKELKIQDRVLKVLKFAPEMTRNEFEHMSDETFDLFLAGIQKQHDDKIAAEKKAEEDRIAKEKEEEKERQRIKEENERLKKEAEEKERLAKIEAEKRAKAEKERIEKEQAERKANEEKARKEREAHEAELKKERERFEKIQREEKAKQQKLEAELKAKQEAESKAKEDAEAKMQAELSKGDSAKVTDLISDLEILKTKYTFKSAKNKKMYNDVAILLDKIINHIK